MYICIKGGGNISSVQCTVSYCTCVSDTPRQNHYRHSLSHNYYAFFFSRTKIYLLRALRWKKIVRSSGCLNQASFTTTSVQTEERSQYNFVCLLVLHFNQVLQSDEGEKKQVSMYWSNVCPSVKRHLLCRCAFVGVETLVVLMCIC